MTASRRSLVLLALLAAACGGPSPGPADAPGGPGAPEGGGPMLTQAPPVYSLLGYRDRLKLTSVQVVALDSIGRAVQEQNGPLLEELRGMAERTGRGRGGRMVVTDEMRPLVDRVRENNERAETAVREVLDDGQEAQACKLYEPREGERGGRGMGRRGMPADSAGFGRGRRVWSWCGPPSPAPARTDSATAR